jgi:hypothetical protein
MSSPTFRIPSNETGGFDARNPEHTGWGYPGLNYANPDMYLRDPRESSKRIFFRLYVLRRFPWRALKQMKKPKWYRPDDFLPSNLHHREGREATVWRLQLLISHILYPNIAREWQNLHVYMPDSDEELPLETAMEDILRGDYGVTSQDQPLRIVLIHGSRGHLPTRFPGTASDNAPALRATRQIEIQPPSPISTLACSAATEHESPPPYSSAW